jgi:hypothetical protein
VANLERFPRRIIHPLFQVRRIELDVGASEVPAEFREEELIGALRPSFNVAGVVWRCRP